MGLVWVSLQEIPARACPAVYWGFYGKPVFIRCYCCNLHRGGFIQQSQVKGCFRLLVTSSLLPLQRVLVCLGGENGEQTWWWGVLFVGRHPPFPKYLCSAFSKLLGFLGQLWPWIHIWNNFAPGRRALFVDTQGLYLQLERAGAGISWAYLCLLNNNP